MHWKMERRRAKVGRKPYLTRGKANRDSNVSLNLWRRLLSSMCLISACFFSLFLFFFFNTVMYCTVSIYVIYFLFCCNFPLQKKKRKYDFCCNFYVSIAPKLPVSSRESFRISCKYSTSNIVKELVVTHIDTDTQSHRHTDTQTHILWNEAAVIWNWPMGGVQFEIGHFQTTEKIKKIKKKFIVHKSQWSYAFASICFSLFLSFSL